MKKLLFIYNPLSGVGLLKPKLSDVLDIFVKAGVEDRSVHIRVIITLGNFSDLVYNDFYMGGG